MSQFDLRDLHAFCVLVQEMHFGRAAQRCHLTQPTLSRTVQRLENDLGVTLFDRTSRQVRLTPAGHAFYPGAQATLRAAAEARQAAQAAAQPRPRLRISSIFPEQARLDGRSLTDTLRAFAPHADLDIHHVPSILGQLGALHAGQDDWAVTIAPLPGNTQGLTVTPLAQARLELALSSNISVPAGGLPLSAVNLPIMLFNRQLSPYHHDQLLVFFEQSAVQLRLINAAWDMQANLEAIAAGQCASLLMDPLRPLHDDPRIQVVPITTPLYFCTIVLVQRTDEAGEHQPTATWTSAEGTPGAGSRRT